MKMIMLAWDFRVPAGLCDHDHQLIRLHIASPCFLLLLLLLQFVSLCRCNSQIVQNYSICSSFCVVRCIKLSHAKVIVICSCLRLKSLKKEQNAAGLRAAFLNQFFWLVLCRMRHLESRFSWACWKNDAPRRAQRAPYVFVGVNVGSLSTMTCCLINHSPPPGFSSLESKRRQKHCTVPGVVLYCQLH